MNDLNPADGQLTYDLDRAHVFHSWSAQGSLNPFISSICVALLASPGSVTKRDLNAGRRVL